jgi:hypothetical protein
MKRVASDNYGIQQELARRGHLERGFEASPVGHEFIRLEE